MQNVNECRDWALTYLNKLPNVNGTAKGDLLKNLKPVPEYIKQKRSEIIAPFPNAIIEPVVRDYLVIVSSGQCVFRHTDGEYEGKAHLRFNWVLSVADEGGEIYVGTKKHTPKINEVLFIDPTIPHWVTVVKGDTPLILISYGILV
jgi:hypothetical protein